VTIGHVFLFMRSYLQGKPSGSQGWDKPHAIHLQEGNLISAAGQFPGRPGRGRYRAFPQSCVFFLFSHQEREGIVTIVKDFRLKQQEQRTPSVDLDSTWIADPDGSMGPYKMRGPPVARLRIPSQSSSNHAERTEFTLKVFVTDGILEIRMTASICRRLRHFTWLGPQGVAGFTVCRSQEIDLGRVNVITTHGNTADRPSLEVRDARGGSPHPGPRFKRGNHDTLVPPSPEPPEVTTDSNNNNTVTWSAPRGVANFPIGQKLWIHYHALTPPQIARRGCT
jgi:hypothetical protein